MWKYAMEKSEDEAKIMYHWENKAHENKPVGVSIENSAEQSVMEKNMLLMLSNQNASKSGVKEALWIMQWRDPQSDNKVMPACIKDGQVYKWSIPEVYLKYTQAWVWKDSPGRQTSAWNSSEIGSGIFRYL